MENKYYTPKLKDLYINSEFEYQTDDKKWHKCSDYINEFASGYSNEDSGWDLNKLIDNNKLRVKYLDKEDIEELGWKFFDYEPTGDGDVRWWSGFKKEEYVLKECNAWQDGNVNITKRGRILFQGNIKNKSKLIDVMKMLDIK